MSSDTIEEVAGAQCHDDDATNNTIITNDHSSTSPINTLAKAPTKISSKLTFRSNLTAGFRAMIEDDDDDDDNDNNEKQRRQQQSKHRKNSGILSFPFLDRIVINFVDPTSTTSLAYTSTTPKPTTTPAEETPSPRPPPPPGGGEVSRFYENFLEVFEKNYKSTLQAVPIQMFRSGARVVAESIEVTTIRSEGGLLLFNNANVNHNGFNREPSDFSESSTGEIDPIDTGVDSGKHDITGVEDLHLTPYCYVYFAACQNLDHYRTKVKPSIQAFVSQLEATIPSSAFLSSETKASASTPSSTSSTATTPTVSSSSNSSTTTSNTATTNSTTTANTTTSNTKCPPYVLVFIPTGERGKPEDSPAKTTTRRQAVGATVASRFAAARRIIATGNLTTASDQPQSNGTTSTAEGSNDAGGSVIDESGSEQGLPSHGITGIQSSVQRLSRLEREVLRRLTNDFPYGNVCTLSSLGPDDSNNNSESDVSFQKAEWTAALKCIGNAVGQGFLQRCQRCDDELRKLDHALRRGNISTKQPNAHNAKGAVTPKHPQHQQQQVLFNWNHFFLVKESLAFTYEQMHLYEEAFLQYEELTAFLPNHYGNSDKAESSTANNVSDLIDDLESDIKKSSSHRIDENGPKVPSSDLTFTGSNKEKKRKLSILALTGNVKKFRLRLQSLGEGIAPDIVEQYILGRQISLLYHMSDPIRIIDRCIAFIQQFYHQQYHKIVPEKRKTGLSSITKEQLLDLEKWVLSFCWDVKESSEVLVHTKSQQIVNEKKLIIRMLCDLVEFASRRMKRAGQILFTEQTNKDFDKEIFQPIGTSFEAPWIEQNGGDLIAESLSADSSDATATNDVVAFIDNSFTTFEAFRVNYGRVLQTVIQYNDKCRRYRYAARFRLELMELHLIQDSKKIAAEQLRSIVDLYGKERWDYCYFTLIFRLASLEREVGSSLQYLTTLVRTFTENTYQSAPTKALHILHDDMLTVISKSDSIRGCRFELAPLFTPVFCLDGLQLPPLGSERNLLKRVYTVGDSIHVTLSLTSFLPKEIEVDDVFISLVPFRVYVAALEDNLTLKPGDVFKYLKLETPVRIQPGENKFKFDWVPLASGQFIVSELTIRWNQVFFTYTARALRRRPTIRVDIVPSEPTQKLDVEPKFLIPGHEQPLKILFSAGSDHVKEGSLKFHATPGLLFCDPVQSSIEGSDSWSTSLVTPLPPCLPGQTVSITTTVKSEIVGRSGDPQEPLLVKLSTLYKFANDEVGEGSTNYIETSLEAKVPTMNQRVVAIKEYDIVPYGIDRALLNVVVICNAPVPVKVKEWSVALPKQLLLSGDDNLNDSLREVSIEYGEFIYLTFDCRIPSRNEETSASAGTESAVSLDVENEFGTLFREVMKLENIGRFPLAKPPVADSIEVPPVPLSVVPSATAGMIGVPIEFSVRVDFSSVPSTINSIVYKISSSGNVWLICGRVEGLLQRNSADSTTTFVAIPSRPGKISLYPLIRLSYLNDTTMVPIPVALKTDATKQSFNCLTSASHMTIAFPQSAGVNKPSTAFAI